MDLNIVGEISRSEVSVKDAQYAEVTPSGNIQMFYRKESIKCNDNTVVERWQYISFCGIWMGSSDNISIKHLLKIVD